MEQNYLINNRKTLLHIKDGDWLDGNRAKCGVIAFTIHKTDTSNLKLCGNCKKQ